VSRRGGDGKKTEHSLGEFVLVDERDRPSSIVWRERRRGWSY